MYQHDGLKKWREKWIKRFEELERKREARDPEYDFIEQLKEFKWEYVTTDLHGDVGPDIETVIVTPIPGLPNWFVRAGYDNVLTKGPFKGSYTRIPEGTQINCSIFPTLQFEMV